MNKNKFRKIRKNKKAQETLATDILITVSIVLIITISLFVVNMLVGEKKEEKINEIKEFISLKTGIHSSGFKVEYIDCIPKNSSGKTIYSRLDK